MTNLQLVDKLLEEKPPFHAWAKGDSLMVPSEALKYIFNHVSPEMNTLEIGAGHTTIIFAIAGSNHVYINPSEDETKRIMEYCSKSNIGNKLSFIHESSDRALTNSKSIPTELDFIFIDGAHRFPFPYIDFHYTESKLKPDGILGLDDIDIPSVKILHDFLCGEDEWQKIVQFSKTAFFKKTSHSKLVDDWQGQNFNTNTFYYYKKKLISLIKEKLSFVFKN